MKKVAVIGAGAGGLAIAIRLAAKGFRVSVFEQQEKAGGKINEITADGFRFDTGPSLFTLPTLVDELLTLGDVEAPDFSYTKLENITRYFFPDGSVVNAFSDIERFSEELFTKLGEPQENVFRYMEQCAELYRLTAKLFIYSPFPSWAGFKTPEAREIGQNISKLKAFSTMHSVNCRSFQNTNTVQLFDRFATYNGSNPYKAPGTLTIIPHLEHAIGAFFPDNGMYSIARALENKARSLGVTFYFNTKVQEIETTKGKIAGLKVNGISESFDIVVNDTDIFTAYPQLLPKHKLGLIYRSQKPSTSALIFYWSIKGQHPQLDLHNILFSGNYAGEFKSLGKGSILDDPTVYIFISSKHVKTDAPDGCENWFTMVNAPYDKGQDWQKLVTETRAAIICKIRNTLGIDIEPKIVNESLLTPPLIEERTGSYRGALYGISSNNPMAAFSRHPNKSRSIEGLYFTGGSVHPGGGIPLCLASAKIIDAMIF
jgi:phytoene desaturase